MADLFKHEHLMLGHGDSIRDRAVDVFWRISWSQHDLQAASELPGCDLLPTPRFMTVRIPLMTSDPDQQTMRDLIATRPQLW
jgi:hypothetical protein